ncbi:Mastermind-like protein 2 [Bagarius yarrelli]|uniref:Mastermind-like protein 2 n=1 Tax=Bagarius yarrelli TaxID=175774 RepID=A0A556U7C3_BAGYA|nr:Mastermind-like protein 2 [Bagarius yarrelli]
MESDKELMKIIAHTILPLAYIKKVPIDIMHTLQGSLRRKIGGQQSGFTANQNGHFSIGTVPDFKRLRVEAGSLHTGICSVDAGQPQSLAGSIALGHVPQRKDPFMTRQIVANDIFNMTLRDMKKEPTDVQTCGQSSADPAMMVFDFKDEGGGQIDPELQDLFDELTKSVPPLNDLELEKMLKQDDDFGLDLGRPSSAGAANPCPLLDKPIKTEYSPDFCQATGSSPQLRPASAGPSFSMANTSLSTSPIGSGQMSHNHVAQTTGTSSRGLPAWPEISHALQLKQMAANQQPKQQTNSLLHHQQNQAGGVRNWSSTMSGHPSSFGQDTISGANGLLSQPRISNQGSGQGKGMTNCLFKPSGYNPSNPTDMKPLSNKPMLHFTPKASTSTTGQQIPHMAVTQSKQTTQQQSTGGHTTQFQLSMQSSCLQPKPLRPPLNIPGPGINYKINHQRQGLTPGPRFSANGCLVTQQQHQSAPSTPQINNSKGQRQLSQPQQHTSETEKFTTQDHFNRHLTRPPPDYKQQHSNIYQGLTPSTMSSNSSDQRDIQSISCQIPNGQGVKMTTSSGDRMFPNRSDLSEVHNCAGQLHQQPNSQMQIGMHQNKPKFQGMASTTQHVRTSASQEPNLGQGLGCLTTTGSRDTAMSWENVTKQLDVKRLPGTVPPQSAQTDAHFPPRHISPPNQVAPHSGLIPLNPGIRGSSPRASQPHIPPLTGISRLNQSSPTQQGCINAYGGTAQSPGAYQNIRAGRLTFDFLQDGDNTVPGINADSDFIDSLLKSGSGNDDWMKDINLEEILGGHS